jgi:hypothetical protein
MKTHYRIWLLSALMTCVVVTMMGCASAAPATNTSDQPVTSKLTEIQARQIIENALQAYNTNDRAGYVRDMDDAMKSMLSESGFKQLHDASKQQNGKFVSIAKIELAKGKTPGYIRWEAETVFEKTKLKAVFAFKQDGDKVTGVTFETIN